MSVTAKYGSKDYYSKRLQARKAELNSTYQPSDLI